MKSERRHELQHNTLDTELIWILSFFRHHWQKLLMGVAIVAIAIMAVSMVVRNRSNEIAEIQNSYAQIRAEIIIAGGIGTDALLDNLTTLAEQTRVPAVAASANVDIGDIHAAAGYENPARAAQAASQYNLVISNFSDQGPAVAKAHMGLAKLAESAGKFDEARTHYQAILSLANDPQSGMLGHPIVTLADAGIKGLDVLKQDVRMATIMPAATSPPAEPAETPAVTPAETPAETPVEMPAEMPAETPAETPAVTPAETPAETLAETPAASTDN